MYILDRLSRKTAGVLCTAQLLHIGRVAATKFNQIEFEISRLFSFSVEISVQMQQA